MTYATSADASATVTLKIVGVSVHEPIEDDRQDRPCRPKFAQRSSRSVSEHKERLRENGQEECHSTYILCTQVYYHRKARKTDSSLASPQSAEYHVPTSMFLHT